MASIKVQDQPVSCPECGFGPFTRNNFFTGKLMTARDFTDESVFHGERMRHHNSRLHGWGVVCGLRVKAHENTACHDRFMVIEPGTAIDCCGNEILVTEAVTVELAQLSAVADLIKKKDTDPHRLLIGIHYQECPTEEVPVLYDECGCDETRCAPNRILSSYSIDAILGDDITISRRRHIPALKWNAPIGPADVTRIVFDGKNKRLYAASDQNTIYQINTETNMIVRTMSVETRPRNLALSKDGDRLFVVADPSAGETSLDKQLLVFDTADLSESPIRKTKIPNSDEGGIELVVAPDDRLFALAGKAGKIITWPSDVKLKGKKASAKRVTIGANLQGLTLSSDGKQAYAIDSDKTQLVAVDVKDTTQIKVAKPVGALAAEAAPTRVTVVSSTGPDLLAVISETTRSLYLVDAAKDKLLGTAYLEYPPVAVAVSSGGQYAYIVEAETGIEHSYVQAVNLVGLQQGLEQVTSEPIQIGDNSHSILVGSSGNRLYTPFTPVEEGTGGIGIIEVSEQDCAEILWEHLEGCPSCDAANSVILATIENYVAGFKVEDPTDPASDPLKDKEEGIARIDNRAGRQLLPSTAVLLETVECLLEQGCSSCTGTQGPPGAGAIVESIPPDPTSTTCPRGGAKITDGSGHVAYVCNGAAGANGTPGTPGTVVTVTPEPVGTNCPNGGIKVVAGTGSPVYVCNGAPGANGTPGTPGTGVTVQQTTDGAIVTGAQGTTAHIYNGTPGANGTPGTVVTVTPEPAGSHCPNGGIKVVAGTNAPVYVCNGTPGANGAPGPGVTVEDVPENTVADCPYGGVKITDGLGQVTYVCNGASGAPGGGMETGLTRINALSWFHNEAGGDPPPSPEEEGNSNNTDVQHRENALATIKPIDGNEVPGIVIQFTDGVKVGSPLADQALDPVIINCRHVFQVFTVETDGQNVRRTQLFGTVMPVTGFVYNATNHIIEATEIGPVPTPPTYGDGVAFTFDRAFVDSLKADTEFWVHLQGDFITDDTDRAIDAEFVRAELPTGNRPGKNPTISDYGMQGGHFESWFWFKKKS